MDKGARQSHRRVGVNGDEELPLLRRYFPELDRMLPVIAAHRRLANAGIVDKDVDSAGLATLFFAALAPSPVRAGVMLIGSPIAAGGYTFTNFDFSPLTGTATGSNINGISNTGQVIGVTVDANGAPTFTNFSDPPSTSLTPLNTGAG